MHSKQQQIEILFHMLKQNNSIYKNLTYERSKMQFIFFVPRNEELEGILDPPKMKVKGYMYPQMKKTGHAEIGQKKQAQ